MYCPVSEFDGDSFIQTSSGNRISRQALISKPQALEIPSGRCVIMPNVIIRCDLAAVQLHKYSFIDEGSLLRPCSIMTTAPSGANGTKEGGGDGVEYSLKFVPLTIGSHTWIGKSCVIEAASIGMGCRIGDNVILSKRCILRDYVYVESNTVVPPDMVLPPFSIVSGAPAKIIGEMPESTSTQSPLDAVARFKNMTPKQRK